MKKFLTCSYFCLVIIVSFFAFERSTEAAAPVGRFGWYTPHGEVVGNDTSCGVGYNKMELVIRARGTNNPISVSSALFISQNLSGSIVSQAQGSGPTVGPICYEPGTQSLGISIDGGSGYYNFEASIMASSTNLIPRGKHIRTIVWLTPVSATVSEYVQQSPIGTMVRVNPDYQVQLNSFPNTYGATALSRGVLFVNQWDTATNKVVRTGGVRFETNLTGGVGTVTFPAITTLPDGRYSWAFYLNLNGSHNPGYGVTELNELKSGLGWFGQYFTLDRAAPQMPAPIHTPVMPGDTNTVVFDSGTAFDAHAGFHRIRLYVNGVLRQGCAYTGQTSARCTWTGGPYPANSTQSYFFVGEDRAGNFATSTTNSFTVLQTTLPDISATNQSPLANATLNPSVTNMFTATITNSTTTSFTGTTTVRFMIDYDSDDAWNPNVRFVANNGVPLGVFTPGQRRSISASMASMPTGRHRYRFHADTGSVTDEANEGNNYSPWVQFYVGVGTTVTATPYICDQINVSWSPIVGVSQYTLLDNGVFLATTSGAVTNYAHRYVVPGSTHVYQVRGDFPGTGGSTSYSTGVSAIGPAACTPDIPDLSTSNLSPLSSASFANGANVTFSGRVTNISNAIIPEGGGAELEVDTYSDGVVDYRLNAIAGGFLGSFNPGQSKNLSASVTLFSGTHRYRFRSDAANLVLESDEFNNQSSWRTFYVRPYTPIGLSASQQDCGTRSIYLSWGTVAGASSYTLMDNGVPFATTTVASTTHTNLVENSSHSYQVRANNAGGGSSYSAPVIATAPLSCTSFTGLSDNTAPPDVEVTVSSSSVLAGQSVDVTWDTTLGGIPDSCSHTGKFNPTVNWAGGTETVTLNDVGREAFVIQCSNNSGSDTDTDIVEVDVLSPAFPPTLSGPFVAETGTARLDWDTNNQQIGGESVCTLRAGSVSGPLAIANLSNGTGDSETGYATVNITAQTTFVLVCGMYSATTTVQIRPTVIET